MGFFKFCRPEHAQSMLDDGTIRITRAAVYRRMEDEMRIPGIGDRVDSVNSIHSFSSSFRGDTPIEQLTLDQLLARELTIRLTGGLPDEVTYTDNTINIVTNNYIWCFSSGNEETALVDFNSTVPSDYRYQAAVRISTIKDLGDLLKISTIETLGGIPVMQFFERIKISYCTYEGNQLQIEGGKYVFSHWAKLPNFAPQKEVRVVFFPDKDGGEENLIVKIPMHKIVFSEAHLRSS